MNSWIMKCYSTNKVLLYLMQQTSLCSWIGLYLIRFLPTIRCSTHPNFNQETSLPNMLMEHLILILNLLKSIVVPFSIMVQMFHAKFVARPIIKPLIVIIAWITPTKEDILQRNLQLWWPIQMLPLKIKNGLLIMVQMIISLMNLKIWQFSNLLKALTQ